MNSIHINAGNCKLWISACGWSCYTSRGQTAGDLLADCLYQAAALWLPGHKLRKDYSDGDPDWESDFYILKNTLCGAALTENLFHDNSDDCLFLESDEGCRAIVALHVE
ncbi:MAG: N-acetylmuramoyl-L-alanine amidase, partial [Bacteroidales bacterium]|nr:N-acetylmuramoyl-L-alanine amidase [Bacteroidales bacterium]